MRRGRFWALLVAAVLFAETPVLTAADTQAPPPPLPRDLPVVRAPVVARPKQPDSLTRTVPRDVADLLAIQKRVGELVKNLSSATVGLRIGNGAGSGVIGINGAAAHLVKPGDKVIICSYVQADDAEARAMKPKICFVDEKNQLR